MTDRELVLEETRKILARVLKPLKKKRAEPGARALREETVLFEVDQHDDVLTRARNRALGVPSCPTPETVKLVEAALARQAGRSAPVPGDLHERLRKAATTR